MTTRERAASTPSEGRFEATVVITTHDRDELAQRAIQSATDQTIHDIEIVVVDDASDPPFVARTRDERVRVIRREFAGGPSAARNTGLADARGIWITFLDDDDVIVPEMLERSIAAARGSRLPQPVAVNAAVVVLDLDGADGEVLVPADELARGMDYVLEDKGAGGRAANGFVVPTDVMREIGGFDEHLAAFQHDDLGLRINAVASIQGVPEPLYRMTTHRDARVSRRWNVIPGDMERTLAKHRDAFERHRGAHATFLGTLGYYHLKAGAWSSAIRWTGRAVRRNPSDRRLWFFLAAAVAGPRTQRAYRRVAPTDLDVPVLTLTRRRMRKYGRRSADWVRAPFSDLASRLTWALFARRARVRARNASRSVLVLCVYRHANVDSVTELVSAARERGWTIRLWALDEPRPTLAEWTIGSGPGAKFPLLNQLADGVDTSSFDWVVVADDDVRFALRPLADLLVVAELAGLDLVQPAHTERSYRTFEFTVRRPLTVARRTTFVEIGPLFAVDRAWSPQVLPFPSEYQMGWGLEIEWSELERRGARFGIVDVVPVRHLVPIGRGYASKEEGSELHTRLAARGLTSLKDVQRTLGAWRAWNARPPWSRWSSQNE